MKKRAVATIIGMVALGSTVAVIWSLSGSQEARDHQAKERGTERGSTTGADTENDPATLAARLRLASGLGTGLAARQSVGDTDDPTEWQRQYHEKEGLTASEIEKLEDDQIAVGKVIWEQAPQVLEEMLLDEERDEEWSVDVRENAGVALQSAELRGTQIHDVECGSTLCKITFIHDDQASFDLFNERGPDVGPWVGNQFGGAMDLPGGGSGSYIYFTRPNDPSPLKRMRQLILARIDHDS